MLLVQRQFLWGRQGLKGIICAGPVQEFEIHAGGHPGRFGLSLPVPPKSACPEGRPTSTRMTLPT